MLWNDTSTDGCKLLCFFKPDPQSIKHVIFMYLRLWRTLNDVRLGKYSHSKYSRHGYPNFEAVNVKSSTWNNFYMFKRKLKCFSLKLNLNINHYPQNINILPYVDWIKQVNDHQQFALLATMS